MMKRSLPCQDLGLESFQQGNTNRDPKLGNHVVSGEELKKS